MANSWNEELGEALGQALGEEANALGVDVLLGPGLNIKRSPLCGRNFEYFSEDPYLSGKMAAAYIKGIQSKGVYACPKHFAVNSQELRRMAMDAVVDERTLREIYLTGFEIAVKDGGAKAIMTSYNQVNGTYANENVHLLKDILREEWKFDGLIVTDWGGSNDHVKGVAAGSNLEMPAPGLDSARQIIRAVEEGRLSTDEVDFCVDGIVTAAMEAEERRNHMPDSGFDQNIHHQLARQAAAESAVLLKNVDHLLPLVPGSRVALIGDFAFAPRYQGAGSSVVNPTRLETMAEMIKEYDLQIVGMARGYIRSGEPDDALRKEALDLAKEADIVIYCFGLDEISESEGLDRNHMRIPQNQIELLEALSKVNGQIVGVVSAGSAIEMPWHSCCKSILNGYLTGQAGAGAMLDLLTGKENPSGRLNETYPVRYEDTPAFRNFPSTERTAEYREGIYVGYRYYDTAKVRVQYPFGYGLSYTDFSYSKLEIDETGVSFLLTNSGGMDGAEVPQLYVGLPESALFRPEKELKGFTKIFLKAGETRKVRIPFDDKTFRFWNRENGRWETETGQYHMMVGACVADIRLEGTIFIKGDMENAPYRKETLPSYYSGLVQQVGEPEFETLLGRPIPIAKRSGNLDANDAICQMYYAKSRIARLVYRILSERKRKSEETGVPDLNTLFIYNMPFRGIAKMTGGAVSMDMVNGIVEAVNGHFFRGMGQVIHGYFVNSRENKAYEKRLRREL